MPIILGYMFQDPQWVPGTANSVTPESGGSECKESASNTEGPASLASLITFWKHPDRASLVAHVVKNLPANTLEKGMATCSSILG